MWVRLIKMGVYDGLSDRVVLSLVLVLRTVLWCLRYPVMSYASFMCVRQGVMVVVAWVNFLKDVMLLLLEERVLKVIVLVMTGLVRGVRSLCSNLSALVTLLMELNDEQLPLMRRLVLVLALLVLLLRLAVLTGDLGAAATIRLHLCYRARTLRIRLVRLSLSLRNRVRSLIVCEVLNLVLLSLLGLVVLTLALTVRLCRTLSMGVTGDAKVSDRWVTTRRMKLSILGALSVSMSVLTVVRRLGETLDVAGMGLKR